MKKRGTSAVLGVAVCLGLGITSAVNAATFNTNFRNGMGHFTNTAHYTFNNEKDGMNVAYQRGNVQRNNTVGVNVRASKTTGSNTTGGWVQTGSLFPNGTWTQANCRVANYGNEADEQNNWAAYWSLFDNVANSGQTFNYYENDIMETYGNGYFLNRYDTKSLAGVVGGESRQYTGTGNIGLRRTWRNYTASWTGSATSFTVQGGQNITLSGHMRGGNHRMIVQNRPWPGRLDNLSNNTALARLECRQVNIDTP